MAVPIEGSVVAMQALGDLEDRARQEGDVIARDASGRVFERYDDTMPLPGMTGDLDEMALYAGQSVGLVRAGGPARDIVAQLVRETRDELDRLHRSFSEPSSRTG